MVRDTNQLLQNLIETPLQAAQIHSGRAPQRWVLPHLTILTSQPMFAFAQRHSYAQIVPRHVPSPSCIMIRSCLSCVVHFSCLLFALCVVMEIGLLLVWEAEGQLDYQIGNNEHLPADAVIRAGGPYKSSPPRALLFSSLIVCSDTYPTGCQAS